MTSSEEESDLSESEIFDYKSKPLNELRCGKFIVNVRGQLRCPFCVGKKKQDYKYKDLLQHATGAGKGSSRKDAKQRANHLALAEYLETDLAHEAEQKPVRDIEPVKEAEKSEHNDLYCWPWTGIVVNIVSEVNGDKMLDNGEYWRAEFSKFKPTHVQVFMETAQVVVKFDNDWSGFKNAMEFEKSFETKHRSKKEWKAQERISNNNVYGWLALADDFESNGPIGIYLRENVKLQTISKIVQEDANNKSRIVANLANEIDIKNENLDELESQYNLKSMSYHRMLEERDMMHVAYAEETKKMQRIAREHVRSILDEQEKMNYELEVKKKDLDSWNRQLNKREALTERERQKLDEEKQMSSSRNTSLEMASVERRKADENLLRLVEEQKKEKQEALNKVLQLERQLDAKQKLEMEIEELKGKLQVMRHLGDEDDDAVQNKIKEFNEELERKQEEMSNLEDLNQALIIKERQSNDELQEARKVLIAGLTDVFTSARTPIGIKRMGDIEMKPFYAACKAKYPPSVAETKSLELGSLWQEKLRKPEWHPFKMIPTEDGNHEQIIDENDEELKALREEWGNDVYESVGTALKEMNEYNPSGNYVISELWNFKENRKATLKEVFSHILKSVKSLKRKRT